MNIAEKLKILPESPGVYLMYDEAGQVIYVGKAVVLKNRVRQYFNNSPKPAKVQAMVDNVGDFGYILTLSEKDAFSLEANLIRKYMPRYNILLKDDKHSPYIKIDLKEDFPTLEITRKVKKDGAKYFGPYFYGIRVNDIAEIIRAAYKIRNCPKSLKKNKRACLHYHINMCSAPCEGLVTKEEYYKSVLKATAFLSGRDDEAEKLLTKKMEDASAAEEFERAIEYRDRLKMLQRLKERSISTGEVKNDADSIAFVWEGAAFEGVKNSETDGIASSQASRNDGKGLTGLDLAAVSPKSMGAVTVNLFRGNKMMGVKNFSFESAALNAADALASFITQYYSQNETPEEILLNIQFDFAGLEEYLSALAGRSVKIACPQKGIKKRLVEMAEKNAAEYIAASADKIKRKFDLTTGAAERLKNILGLKSARRIECYDISNISGTDSVASGVVFIDGEASKSDYRRYKIKTVKGADDFASMREVILRRLKGDLPPPDLIVIDGGKGQLSAALSAAREAQSVRAEFDAENKAGFTIADKAEFKTEDKAADLTQNTAAIPFISLAEREELIYVPNRDEPIALSKNDYALRLLQRIRDEAHRFALSYHTRLRNRKIDSELLSIPGVGPKKRAKLLKNLSFKEIKSLTADDLVAKTGIDKAAAESIEKYFSDSKDLY